MTRKQRPSAGGGGVWRGGGCMCHAHQWMEGPLSGNSAPARQHRHRLVLQPRTLASSPPPPPGTSTATLVFTLPSPHFPASPPQVPGQTEHEITRHSAGAEQGSAVRCRVCL